MLLLNCSVALHCLRRGSYTSGHSCRALATNRLFRVDRKRRRFQADHSEGHRHSEVGRCRSCCPELLVRCIISQYASQHDLTRTVSCSACAGQSQTTVSAWLRAIDAGIGCTHDALVLPTARIYPQTSLTKHLRIKCCKPNPRLSMT